jgi:hypothetical protein
MNVEFHYYIVYFLSKEAGFSEQESQIIAYSCQYVDNNLVPYKIQTGTNEYNTTATQNYGFWNDSFPKNVYLPFHFFPGDKNFPNSLRWDAKKNIYNCTPDSSNVKRLFIDALKTKNLYRVGIAIHTYSDSWAHQNFSGFDEEWNNIDPGSLIPHIGHAQVIGKPDLITEVWRDERLAYEYQQVDNKERFLEAARKIYKYLRAYNKLDFSNHNDVIEKLRWLTGIFDGKISTMEDRIYSYILDENMLKYNQYDWFKEAVYHGDVVLDNSDGAVGYEKFLWMKDTIRKFFDTKERQILKAKDDFYSTHWYKWNEAAKGHLSSAKRILSELPEK